MNKRDLLRLYDLATAGVEYVSFQLNAHLIDSRTELEAYPLESIEKLRTYSVWRFNGNEVTAAIDCDSRYAVCNIDDDRHAQSMAVMALADELLRIHDPANAQTESATASCDSRAQRRVVAILHADVVGYSLLTAADEAGTHQRFLNFRSTIVEPAIIKWHGHIVGSAGDSLLVWYPSAVGAMTSAMEMQHGLAIANASLPKDRRMLFRIGINLGDVIVEDKAIHGDDVNIAERIEKLASPGGLCVSSGLFQVVSAKLDLEFRDMGEQKLKNIKRPVRVYRVELPTARESIEWL